MLRVQISAPCVYHVCNSTLRDIVRKSSVEVICELKFACERVSAYKCYAFA